MAAVKPSEDLGLQSEIDALRPRFPNTQDLYREACVILFFRHGITPTANKLYQLVRKGSMSAPAEALARFWSELREKSRVQVDHADLPEDLKVSAGELIGALWSKALGEAHASLASIRQELEAEAEQGRVRTQTAESELAHLKGQFEEARGVIRKQEDILRQREQALAGETATRQALEREVNAARLTISELQQSANDARSQFAAQMEQLHQVQASSESRYLEAERRLRAELDRERAAVGELKEALDRSQATIRELTEHRKMAEVARAEQAAEHRQRIGQLEGELRALGTARTELLAELASERTAVSDLTHRLSSATREADRWQLKTIEAHREIEVMKAARLRKSLRENDPELNLGIPQDRRSDQT